ncbi:hypothetical protein B0H34DRAFT_858887 [Crassisporium funariophilum]|nr:hypothetical protein B0H34DRAFT_858887 [Crassisporium funariophilum]
MPFPERPSLLAVFDPNDLKPPARDARRRGKEQKILPSVAELMCGEDNWSLRLPPLCTSDQGLERRSKLLPLPPIRSVPCSTTAPPDHTQPLPSRGIKRRRSYTPSDDQAPGFAFVEYGPDSTTERDATVAPESHADNYVFEVAGATIEVQGKTRRNEKKPEPKKQPVFQCRWMLVAGMCDFRGAKSTVTRHVNGFHLGLKPYPCTYGDCERSFAQNSTLKVHTDAIHTHRKPHACRHCEAKFSDPAHRSKHVEREHPEMPRKKRQKLNRGRSAYRNEPKSST